MYILGFRGILGYREQINYKVCKSSLCSLASYFYLFWEKWMNLRDVNPTGAVIGVQTNLVCY